MADRKLEGGLNGGEAPAVDSTWGESKLDARKLRMQAGVVPTSRQAREFMREAAALHAALFPAGCSGGCEECEARGVRS